VEYERRTRVGKQKRAFARYTANIFKYMHDVLPAVRFFCIYIIRAALANASDVIAPCPLHEKISFEPDCTMRINERNVHARRKLAIRDSTCPNRICDVQKSKRVWSGGP